MWSGFCYLQKKKIISYQSAVTPNALASGFLTKWEDLGPSYVPGICQAVSGAGAFTLLVPVLVCSGCHTKVPLSGSNNINLFSHSSGGWKSQIKVTAGLISSETSVLGLLMAAFAASSHGLGMWSFLCGLHILGFVCQVSCPCKDTSQIVRTP